MYLAHSKRIAVDRLTHEKVAMISGMWSNSNLDDGKNTREQALKDIEDNYQLQLLSVYTEGKSEDEIEFDNHPFFSAMNLDGPHPS